MDQPERGLTVDATRIPIAQVLTDYAWLWEDDGLEVSINPDEYYAVAVEANGNLTLAHRDDGRPLLFTPDTRFRECHAVGWLAAVLTAHDR